MFTFQMEMNSKKVLINCAALICMAFLCDFEKMLFSLIKIYAQLNLITFY